MTVVIIVYVYTMRVYGLLVYIAVYVGTTVVSGRKHRRIVVKCTHGISCRLDMAASDRPPFAIHGQICTATLHNKRRPLVHAAGADPPFSQSDRPLKPTRRPTVVASRHTRTPSHFNFSPPPRILSLPRFSSEATRRNPTSV